MNEPTEHYGIDEDNNCEMKMTLKPKEDLLREYLRDLDRLADVDVSSQTSDHHNDNEAHDHEWADLLNEGKKERFDSLKEKAFEILIKAEQLNDEIEREMTYEHSFIDESRLLRIVQTFNEERHYLSLKDDFQVYLLAKTHFETRRFSSI